MNTPAQEHLKGGLGLLILATLRDGPAHGYALARTIERRTEDVLRLREGTLYPALHALERDGLIVAAWETPPHGRERKVYTLTEDGHRKLAAWSQGWRQFAQAVARVLAPQDAPTGQDIPTEGDPTYGPEARPRRLRPAPGGSLS